jgi:hypothetical protein
MNKTFLHHTPTRDALEKIKQLRIAYTQLHDLLDATCYHSRELSKAKTELEDSAMWAIKSIVCNDPQSKVEVL